MFGEKHALTGRSLTMHSTRNIELYFSRIGCFDSSFEPPDSHVSCNDLPWALGRYSGAHSHSGTWKSLFLAHSVRVASSLFALNDEARLREAERFLLKLAGPFK